MISAARCLSPPVCASTHLVYARSRRCRVHGDLPELLDNIINCLEHSPSMRLIAEIVARKLRYLREAFEREVLGVGDYATDVSGPPVSLFAQRDTTANLVEPLAAA